MHPGSHLIFLTVHVLGEKELERQDVAPQMAQCMNITSLLTSAAGCERRETSTLKNDMYKYTQTLETVKIWPYLTG